MEEITRMNDKGQIKLWLKEAGFYLQFLNENMDSIESIRKTMSFRLEQLLKDATESLRESVNLLNLEVREARKKGDSHQ